MHLVVTSAIIINLLAIAMLLIGLFCNFKRPKYKAVFGYFITGSMLLYIISLGIFSMYMLVAEHNLFGLILAFCVVSPFIIGKLVKYETLKIYTVAQILCFVVSLIVLIFEL